MYLRRHKVNSGETQSTRTQASLLQTRLTALWKETNCEDSREKRRRRTPEETDSKPRAPIETHPTQPNPQKTAHSKPPTNKPTSKPTSNRFTDNRKTNQESNSNPIQNQQTNQESNSKSNENQTKPKPKQNKSNNTPKSEPNNQQAIVNASANGKATHIVSGQKTVERQKTKAASPVKRNNRICINNRPRQGIQMTDINKSTRNS
jgi:hypothetical protein